MLWVVKEKTVKRFLLFLFHNNIKFILFLTKFILWKTYILYNKKLN